MPNLNDLLAMFSDAELIAFQRILSGEKGRHAVKAAKARLGPGTHQVNASLRLTGSVTVGENISTLPTTSVPWKIVAALLIQKLDNLGTKGLEAIIVDLVNESQKVGGKRSEEHSAAAEYFNDFDAAIESVNKILKRGLVPVSRPGNAKMDVDPVMVHHRTR